MTNQISHNQNSDIMMTVKVTYSVKHDYVETNKEMISKFLEDFKTLATDPFQYSVYLKEDGATFVHLSQYSSKQAQNDLLQVPSFVAFQERRDQHMASEHQLEVLDFIGSSKDTVF